MIQCERCGEPVASDDTTFSEEGQVCPSCNLELEEQARGPSGWAQEQLDQPATGVTALVAILVPFAITCRVNNILFTSVGGGALAVVLGLVALRTQQQMDKLTGKFFAGFAIIELLGVFHVVNGLGLV